MVVIRLLLTVVISAALIAVTIPVVQDARHQSAETAAEATISRICGVIDELTARSDPTEESPGAGRTLTLMIPDPTPGSVGIEWLALGGVPGRSGPKEPDGTDLISYSVDGTVHITRLPSVDLRVRTNDRRRPDHIPLVLQGSTEVRFTYRTGQNGPVIIVRTQDS